MTGLDDGTRITVEVEAFLRLARAGDADRCAGLLEQTPDLIDSVEAGGFAALHFAAFYGHVQLLRLLIEKKANLELKNYDYNTPLMLAAKGRQHEAIKILVAAGAKVNATGKGGATAVHHAAGMGYIDTVRELIALGAKVSGEKADTGSPLHWAAHSGNVSMLGVLLFEMRVPIDCVDGHGGTPLFTAVFSKHSEAARFLLENGADVNHATNDNSTVLHIAAAQGKLEDVKMILMFGAKAEATDNDGDTPVKLAEGKKEVLTELNKPAMTAEKRAEESARLKAHGNKVFAEGENNKAARLYTQAIALEKTNHVYFSNRSACYFNTQQYQLALFDALRCIELAPKWPKGFLRKAATLKALKQYDSALEACAAGLALDAGNADLETVRSDILAIKGSQ